MGGLIPQPLVRCPHLCKVCHQAGVKVGASQMGVARGGLDLRAHSNQGGQAGAGLNSYSLGQARRA